LGRTDRTSSSACSHRPVTRCRSTAQDYSAGVAELARWRKRRRIPEPTLEQVAEHEARFRAKVATLNATRAAERLAAGQI
jgi:hypothetical protein